MKVLCFDTHKFEKENYKKLSDHQIQFEFIETRLNESTVNLAQGYQVISAFVNDNLNKSVIEKLSQFGVKLIALRSAGYNNVDLEACRVASIKVVRVPEYSPHAVAEHALALLLTLNRKIHKAYNRIKESNFALDGLVGFDLYKKNVGVIGTGKIGKVFCKIMLGLGCNVYAFDLIQDAELIQLGVKYTELTSLLKEADIISLHVPLNNQTLHLINDDSLKLLKKNCIIINTGRGALIDAKALITALKKQTIGGAALDVYEEESGIFFENLSEQVLQDDKLIRLINFPNVIITSHQGFLTQEALENISNTTYKNIKQFLENQKLQNEVL